MKVDAVKLLNKYFDSACRDMITAHGMAVASLSVRIGQQLGLDDTELAFLDQAAQLHDIGVCQVHAPEIGLHGKYPYIMHGILGRQILESEELPVHAMVCERHIGTGLDINDIIRQNLPLPKRDMTPQTISEQIICFSDLFFSKKPGKLNQIQPVDKVRKKLAAFGNEKLQIFDNWLKQFGEPV